MKNFFISNKIIWLFLIIGIIAVVTTLVLAFISRKSVEPTANVNNTQNLKLQVERKDIPTSQLPPDFPAEIPMEPGSKVTQNYTAQAGDGRFQMTRAFETQKSLEENFRIYQSFFQRNNWTIVSTVNQPSLKGLLARKGGLSVQVSINENAATKVKTVDITVTKTQ
jgi:hypothetical protein